MRHFVQTRGDDVTRITILLTDETADRLITAINDLPPLYHERKTNDDPFNDKIWEAIDENHEEIATILVDNAGFITVERGDND